MRRIEMMTAGGVTLAGLGALVGLAVGSSDGGQKLVAQRAQPVEVRTQIIRKTINVYRREHPHHAAGSGPGGARAGTLAQSSITAAPVATRTRASGGAAVTPVASAAPVATRSSGSRGTSGSTPRVGSTPPAGSGAQPVRSRTSGASSSGASSSGASSGSAHPVSTRSSGGGDGGDGGGGHGD